MCICGYPKIHSPLPFMYRDHCHYNEYNIYLHGLRYYCARRLTMVCYINRHITLRQIIVRPMVTIIVYNNINHYSFVCGLQ